jgi:hypothetical protein
MATLLDEDALDFIVRTLKDLTVDVDVDDISAVTVIKALGLRSIVLINAVAEIQEHFNLENKLLERILAGTIPLDEYRVGDLVELVVAADSDVADSQPRSSSRGD